MRVFFVFIILTVLCCSCQSSNVMPPNPFDPAPQMMEHAFNEKTPPPKVELPIEAEQTAPAKSEILFLQPEYKPKYGSQYESSVPCPVLWDGDEAEATRDRTRVVRKRSSQKSSGVIQQVAFLQETDAEENVGSDSVLDEADRNANLNDIVIDPKLLDRGAVVYAEYQGNYQGNFRGNFHGNFHNGVQQFQGPWRPNANLGFWPQQEYLVDGGDDQGRVHVAEDWTVYNLEAEDTVAHFDTLDGRTLVEPSNRVHIYAPRFGAVRKIEGVLNSGQIVAITEASGQWTLDEERNKEQLGYTAQETQTGYARTRDQLSGLRSRKASTGAENVQGLIGYSNFEAVMLYSNWLRQRNIGSAELAYLAEGSAGARAWQGREGVKVQMDALVPVAATSEEGAESFFQIEVDESKTSKLRLIKVASKNDAKPGEIVEFTLRFDNVGSQPIGNVTILDNLTTRLEFLPGTAKSSMASGFVVQPNESGSFTLRFEITDPLSPGEFGVVQFQCRVR